MGRSDCRRLAQARGACPAGPSPAGPSPAGPYPAGPYPAGPCPGPHSAPTCTEGSLGSCPAARHHHRRQPPPAQRMERAHCRLRARLGTRRRLLWRTSRASVDQALDQVGLLKGVCVRHAERGELLLDLLYSHRLRVGRFRHARAGGRSLHEMQFRWRDAERERGRERQREGEGDGHPLSGAPHWKDVVPSRSSNEV